MVVNNYNRRRSLGLWSIWLGGLCLVAILANGRGPTAELRAASIATGQLFAAPAKAAVKQTTRSAPLIGDATLRGEIDLSKVSRRGTEMSVDLARSRTAILTLDPAVQSRADSVLRSSEAREGAVVVMGLDGRVLALAGRRAAKPAKRDYKLAVEVWAPAASIFKLVTSAALLEDGVRKDSRVCFHGGVRSVEKSHLTDNPAKDRHCADFRAGLARSQNAIIAKLTARHLNRKELATTAERLGFDSAVDFALDVEANRFELPSDKLELARVAAGFWSTEISPIGAAVLTATIASGGLQITPRIVKEVRGPGGVRTVLPRQSERVLKPDIAAALGDMMESTCENGTARSAFRDAKGRRFLGGERVAGKTGSLSISTPSFRGYSWFVGYAPADDPVAVIAVLLANPPKWRLKAHTAARLVLEAVL